MLNAVRAGGVPALPVRQLRPAPPPGPDPADLLGAHTLMLPLPLPGTGGVRLWWARTDRRPDLLPRLRELADAATARRADRLLRPADRLRTLVAHALLRQAAAAATGLAPAEVTVRRRCPTCGSDDHGRPYLSGPAGSLPAGGLPDVSVAHGGRLAVVVTGGPGLQVGVDVEEPQPGPDRLSAATAVLSPLERLRSWRRLDREAVLLRAWTGKEAVGKALGCGLGEDPQGIEVLGAARLPGGWWQLRTPSALLAFPRVSVPDDDPDPRPAHQLAIAALGSPVPATSTTSEGEHP